RLEGDRSKVRFVQTNLARLILAAQIERTKADFAVMSGGGVRDSIAAGPISYKDVLKVQPFGNTLCQVEMTGREVEKYLAVVANKQVDSGAYAQFANVSLVADGEGVSEIKINGEPLQADKTYRMATLSFNANGGDGYPVINTLPGFVNTGFVDAEVLKQYIEKHSPLKAADYAPHDEIVHLSEAEKAARQKQESHRRSYPQMILAWLTGKE
ncbi:bifunctional UDP-sugar hydrolase/5'-nucleotidase, partial [Pantoea sp. PSNIH4]